MPPLLNAAAVLQCGHGGVFPLSPRGPRPLVGGTPGLTTADLPGAIAAGCAFNVSGAPVPCVLVSATAGVCVTTNYGGVPALHQGLVCATSNGVPTLPLSTAGQMTVQGT